MITVASEIMAILCLATSLSDLKERMGNILIAYDLDGNPVYAKQLEVQGAMALLMKDAVKPNLVQTLENTTCQLVGTQIKEKRMRNTFVTWNYCSSHSQL